MGFKLSDVTLQCNTGELVMVCGKVGSGKSSLLSAVLGEMDRAPTPGASDQEPRCCGWQIVLERLRRVRASTTLILNKTVRENVLMGMPLDSESETALEYLALLLT